MGTTDMSARDIDFTSGQSREDRKAIRDERLRRNLLNVYNYMASGVLLTAIVSLLFAKSGAAETVFQANGKATILGWVIILAPLAYVFFVAGAISRMSIRAAQFAYWSFTAVIGLSMSTVFLTYTDTSIATTFFATSAAFAGLSLFGYTTKRDLGPIGGFLIMAVWGLIAAMLINLFVGSGPMSYLISAAGIVIFAGLTAYDTQKIRNAFLVDMSDDEAERLAITGALELYLDFVNLMLHLLRFMGVKKD